MNGILRSPHAPYVAIVVFLCLLGAVLKLTVLGTVPSGDYTEYLATAQLFDGSGDKILPHRLLKPLNPLLMLGMGTFTDYETASLVQAVTFYFAFCIAIYFFAYEFFRDRFGATIIALFAGLSYPVLKYGVDLNSETGALFFYVISLLLTLKFVRQPSWPLVALNAFFITMAFLWKEYAVVSGMVFGLALLFHPAISSRTKALFISLSAIIFLAVHIPWQTYIYFVYDYSYLSWYTHNVTSAVAQHEFSLFNITKSTAALIGFAWLAVPFGMRRLSELTPEDRRFIVLAAPPPFIAYAWGYVSSRLLYVIAPAFLLIAYLGMRSWDRRYQIAFVIITISANLTWLLISNKFTAAY